jgi:hypothetical protein
VAAPLVESDSDASPEPDLAALMRRWERARQGDGQLALIVGIPPDMLIGISKVTGR